MGLDPKWMATIDDAITNTTWDDYDKSIQSEISDYNTRFAATPGYATVDWKLIKAMLWTESGGPSSAAWSKRVMQIGNPGDPAYSLLKGEKDHSDLIMAAGLATDLKDKKKSIDDPQLNIRAAVAYLFTRLAKFEHRSVDDPSDTTDHEVEVERGDGLEKIAKRVGTTVATLERLNPGVKVLHPKQKLKYRKASMQWVISGWHAFTTANVALKYNGGGDANYGAKLDYCLDVMTKLKR